jgi:hypothetical protein
MHQLILTSTASKVWWARKDLNLGPTDYESAALTAELRAPRFLTAGFYIIYTNIAEHSGARK